MPNTLLPIRLPLNCRGRKEAIGTDARKSGSSTTERACGHQNGININGISTLTLVFDSGAAVEICLSRTLLGRRALKTTVESRKFRQGRSSEDRMDGHASKMFEAMPWESVSRMAQLLGGGGEVWMYHECARALESHGP